MKENGWELEYVGWEDFKRAILKGGGLLWERLQRCHLVVGGMDFTIDFMWFFSS